jgi:carbamoyltransferase
MYILGINAYHGDAAAAIVSDGELIAAAEEERFTRVKHQAGFPAQAVRYCLGAAGIQPHEVTHVAVSRNPSAHLHRKILFALSRRPSLGMVRDRLANAAKVGDVPSALAQSLDLPREQLSATFHRVEHHRSHMASAFLVSPFDSAACLSIDGFGDFVSCMWGTGEGTSITPLDYVAFPHSLGIFYTAVTQYLGFLKYGDEYKVMGLAPYGEAEFLNDFRRIVRLHPRGFRLDLGYFLHHSDGVAMTWDRGEPVLGRVYSEALVKRLGPARAPGEPLQRRHQNLAASLQALAEEIYFHLLRQLHTTTGQTRLCLAGGVAFNSVANGKIIDHTPFEEVYIQPAAGDAGTALGAAFSVWHQLSGRLRTFEMQHAYWGPEFSDAVIDKELTTRSEALVGCKVSKISHAEALCQWTAGHIAAGKVVGWFQGRMEWGPRALGNRSILADPRRADMKNILNARIKRREPFRPFCPSILQERVEEYFPRQHTDPFMITVLPIHAQQHAVIPAVTHVDGSGRLQTVSQDTNPLYWRLLKAFAAQTGVPVLLNTSFNENEPIVCTPAEALDCFLRTRMDVLVMGGWVVTRDHCQKSR